MAQQKVCALSVLLLVSNVSLWAMDQADSLARAGFDIFGRKSEYPLHDIAKEIAFKELGQSLDRMLWVLKKTGEDPEKKDTQGKTCVDYLNRKKFTSSSNDGFLRHIVVSYYFERVADVVWRSGAFRQTYPRGRTVPKQPPVFCNCLEQAQGASTSEAVDADSVPESLLPVHPAQIVLKCSELQKNPAYVAWQKVLQNIEQMSEDQKGRLYKKWKPLLNDWLTFRIAAALSIESGAESFQHALLQDDYDLVSYMLQHKMVTGENTFFARTVPMLELLDQYGILTLTDHQQNNPFHHFAQHGRLLYPQVIDFYLRKGVDPLAKNNQARTPLHLLAQHSYRFDGYEQRLQKFIDMLLAKGATYRDKLGRCDLEVLEMLIKSSNPARPHRFANTVLELAQETHEQWNLPATALVLERLRAQERSDVRYAQFLKFRKAFAITYPRVEGDTPLHTVVKMMLQKHDRLTEFVPSFKEMGLEERLAFFKTEFETIEALLRQGCDFAAQNSLGKTLLHELCADWHLSTKQRDILYRKLLRLIFTCQTALATYYGEGKQDVLADQLDIRLMSERLQTVLALKDNEGVSVLDMVCDDSKQCTHEDYWCAGALLLGTTVTFKSRLIEFLMHDQAVEVHENYKWVLGLYESIKKNNEC